MVGKYATHKWWLGVAGLAMSLMFAGSSLGAEKGIADTSRIYVNTASVKRLSKAPGVNEALAAQIVKYRKECGFFKAPEDLLRVPGITKDIFEKMNIRVSPEGFLYCVPEEGEILEEEEEGEPVIAPTKPRCHILPLWPGRWFQAEDNSWPKCTKVLIHTALQPNSSWTVDRCRG